MATKVQSPVDAAMGKKERIEKIKEYTSTMRKTNKQLNALADKLARNKEGVFHVEVDVYGEKKTIRVDRQYLQQKRALFDKQLGMITSLATQKKSGSRTSAPFHISHQFIQFVKEVRKEIHQLKDVDMDLILKQGIATSGFMNSLIHFYCKVKGLVSEDGTLVYDDLMKRCFSDTHFRDLKGKIIDVDRSKLKPRELERLGEGDKSALQLLEEKDDGEGVPNAKNGRFQRKGVMTLVNYFRLPSYLHEKCDAETVARFAALHNDYSRTKKEMTSE